MMAKEIKLSQIGDHMEGQVEQLLRATVFEADGMLKERSPVDTGRFRVSWQIGENSSNSTPAREGDYKDQHEPPPEGPNVPKGSNYIVGQEKLGNYYSIHNNLPYAEALANGHSPQAKAGWIDLIAKEMQSFVRSSYEQIKRQG
jgi:hypothetical protein